MKKRIISIMLTSLLASGTAYAAGKAHWGYSGHEGPEHWGELAPEFSACAAGKNQSPINLTEMVEGELPELKIDYVPGGYEIVNNGHTVQVNYAPGSTITIGSHTYELKQFHFHSPSENHIKGHSYPMEAHFVHMDKEGNLAVIAVMFEPGKGNPELEEAWKEMPEHAGEHHTLHHMVNANALIPHNHAYYRFNGSLTTPPCSEGVNWLVMKQFDKASQEQIEKFVHAMHHHNNRPIQPLNARVVVQ